MARQHKLIGLLGIGFTLITAGLIGTAQPASAAGLYHTAHRGQTFVGDYGQDGFDSGNRDGDHRREERRQEEFRQAEFRRQQEIRREEERRREEWHRDHQRDFQGGDRHDDHRDWHNDNHDWHDNNR